MTDLLQLLDRFEKEAASLEPHHEYKEDKPSPSGKYGVRCILCDHYTNGMERGNCSPCPKHASHRILLLCKVMRIAAQDLQSAHNITQDTRLRNFLRESLERIQGLMRNEK